MGQKQADMKQQISHVMSQFRHPLPLHRTESLCHQEVLPDNQTHICGQHPAPPACNQSTTQQQAQLNSSLLKTVAGRLKEIQVNKKTNKTNKINELKTIKREPQNKNSSITVSF